MNVTAKLLSTVGPKGKYLVVRLTRDHVQAGCQTVPAGTVGVIKGKKPDPNGGHVFVFPHTVLNESIKAFSDGVVRIVPSSGFIPVGRVG